MTTPTPTTPLSQRLKEGFGKYKEAGLEKIGSAVEFSSNNKMVTYAIIVLVFIFVGLAISTKIKIINTKTSCISEDTRKFYMIGCPVVFGLLMLMMLWQTRGQTNPKVVWGLRFLSLIMAISITMLSISASKIDTSKDECTNETNLRAVHVSFFMALITVIMYLLLNVFISKC